MHSWRVPVAARMRPVIGFYIFGASLQNFVQSTKSKETYTTVRFSFRKDRLLAGARMRPVIEFYIAKEGLSLRELAPANPVQSFT